MNCMLTKEWQWDRDLIDDHLILNIMYTKNDTFKACIMIGVHDFKY